MSKLSAARNAYRRGGARGLTESGRRYLAGVIYPGQMPSPPAPPRRKRPRSKATPAAAPIQESALTVGYEEAMAWFGGRDATYRRLAGAIAPYLDEGGVLFDVGANVGYFTKVVVEVTGFRGSAHLFEPLPHLNELCARTIADLSCRAELHEFGLGDADTTIELRVSPRGNLGWNTMVVEKTWDSMIPVDVPVRTFDGCGVTETPSVIKIDVEGAEHRVLTGMLDSLARWETKPVILCEIGWGQGHPEWEAELAAFDALAALGYRATTLEGDAVDVRELAQTSDVLFLPA